MTVIIVKDKTQIVTLHRDKGKADMARSVYDTNSSGKVDDAEKVNGHTVETDVPTAAVFTDTVPTVEDLGLERVDNTNDSEKEISNDVATALNTKVEASGTSVQFIKGDGSFDSNLYAKLSIVLNLITTGIYSGGFLTPNVDTTKFDISDGSGLVVDAFTVPGTPTFIEINWSNLTAIVPTYIAGFNISFIAINSAGGIVQQNIDFTIEQRRDLIVLGSLVHADGVNITTASDETHDVSSSYLADDFAIAMGDINIFGNDFDPASTDLTICKTAGKSFKHNSNRKNALKNPNFLDSVLIPALTFLRIYDNGSGGVTAVQGQTDVDPDIWDDGTGTPATVSANKWTNKWCYFFPSSGVVAVRLGTVEYSNLEDAQAGIIADQPPVIGIGLNTEFIRTVISVKVGSTNLSDISQALFKHSNKFGLI